MDGSESEKPRYFKIDSPVTLEEGKNFYDQPPFNDVLPQVAEQYKIALEDLQYAVTEYAKRMEPMRSDLKTKALERHQKYRNTDPVRQEASNFFPLTRLKTEDFSLQNGGAALLEATGRLHNAPEWMQYVATKLNGTEGYSLSGKYARSEDSNDPSRTPSYAAWYEKYVAQNARIENAAVRSVAAEAIPQPREPGSVRRAPRPQIRRWLIRQQPGIKAGR